MIVQVQMAVWEIQCCRPAPEIGQRVEWQLGWEPGGGEGAGSAVLPWESLHPGADEALGDGWTLTLDGVTAWCAGSDRPDPRLPGTLRADSHGGLPEPVRATAGTVQRVQVVERVYRRVAERTWRPVPGRGRLRQVPTGPWRLQPLTARADGTRTEDAVVVVRLLVP